MNNFIVTPVVIGCNPDMGMFLQDSQKNNPVEGLSEINFRIKKALITSDTHQRTLYETGRTSTVKRESARKSKIFSQILVLLHERHSRTQSMSRSLLAVKAKSLYLQRFQVVCTSWGDELSFSGCITGFDVSVFRQCCLLKPFPLPCYRRKRRTFHSDGS